MMRRLLRRATTVPAVLFVCSSVLLAQESPPLDDVPGAAAAFGMDQLHSGYIESVVRLRRSPDDAETDIGLVGSSFDQAAFDAFRGAGDVYVRSLYDQSGNSKHAAQPVPERQPLVVYGEGGKPVLRVSRTQGMSIPDAYEDISGADELTVFVAANWDGAAAEDRIHLLTAGRYVPRSGAYPFSVFLNRSTRGDPATPQAQLKFSDGSRVDLGVRGAYGRSNTFEIHEVVFDKNDRAALYNSGRLVEEVPMSGLSLLASPPYEDGLFLGTNGSYNRGLTGQITPPLVFNRALTDAERDIVRQSIARTYGIVLPENAPPSGDEFTIAFLPDTQEYASGRDGTNAGMIQNAVDWLLDQRDAWNLRLVVHPGDVVDDADDPSQWVAVQSWYETIESASVPYVVAVGNHDYQGSLSGRNSANFNAFLPVSRLTSAPWWNEGGFYESGKSDNLYFTYSIGGTEYLMLTLEFQPRADVVQWANSVLAAHPDKHAIVVTHDFMDERGQFDTTTYSLPDATSSQQLYDNLIGRHENIFLVLNGHHARGTARRYDALTDAHYLYFDPMLLDWGNQALIRLLVVSPSRGTIRVMTYSPDSDVYRSDYENLFTVDTVPSLPPPDNTAPTISAIADQEIEEDGSTGPLAFTVGDLETPAELLSISASSDNQALVPNGNLALGGVGAERSITVAPAPNANGGPANITVRVSDGFLSRESTFGVSVTAVNDPPSFTSQAVLEAIVGQLYSYSVEVADPDAGDQIVVTATSLPAWLALATEPAASLSGTPQDADIGSHSVVLVATDSSGEAATQEFVVEVASAGMAAYVLLAEKKVVVEKHLDGSGDIHSNDNIEIKDGLPSTLTGNVSAVGELKINKENSVVGIAVSGEKADIDDEATVTGGWTAYADVARVDLPDVAPFAEGSTDFEVKDGENKSLPPGEYDEVKVGKDAVLNLSAGTYRMRRLEIGERSMLAADVTLGGIVVGTTDKFTFKKYSVVSVTPEDKTREFTLESVGDSDIKFEEGAHVEGMIVAPFSKLEVETSVSLHGSFAAEEIILRSEVAFSPFISPGQQQVGGDAAAKTSAAVADIGNDLPSSSFDLGNNFPNPFRASTTIPFQLPRAAYASLTVYDLLGRTVSVLVDEELDAGRHQVVFVAEGHPAGLYIYHLVSEGKVASGKMTIVR